MDPVRIMEIGGKSPTHLRGAREQGKCRTSTWDEILQNKKPPPIRLIFTCWRNLSDAPEASRRRVQDHFKIPNVLFTRVCVDSNGFCGCEDTFTQEGKKLEGHSLWFRFMVKQTFEALRPKKSFIQHDPTGPPIHGDASHPYGWVWYEMTFFARWLRTDSMDSVTILCFDLPKDLQESIQTSLPCSMEEPKPSDPYCVPSFLISEIITLYDKSVWSLRNHISAREANREKKADYSLLHEIARHTIHVSETLSVAVETTKKLQQQQGDFQAKKPQSEGWPPSQTGNHIQFQVQVLQGLHARSIANGARVENEITLAFNTAAQYDSQTQVQISEQMKKESNAMKTISVVTMLFLPATFVSAIFSTSFFKFELGPDGRSESYHVSRHFWVYWVFALSLTCITFLLWYFWDPLAEALEELRRWFARTVHDMRR